MPRRAITPFKVIEVGQTDRILIASTVNNQKVLTKSEMISFY